MAENDILSQELGEDPSNETDLAATDANEQEKPKDKPPPVVEEKEFYRNLAEELDQDELDEIATSLFELIKKDKEDRKRRDDQYKEGLQRMGLDKEVVGGANFSGASNVVHPMYTKACIDFEARAIKELFPPAGPVREYVSGTITPERADRAHRKASWLNFQCVHLMPNLRDEMEQILMNLPMGGNQYLKLIPPSGQGGIETVAHEWIPIDRMLLPYAATNYYTAERRTHVQEVTSQEFDRRQRSGMYRDISILPPAMPVEQTGTAQSAARIEGKDTDSSNPDGVRTIYECDCIFEIRDPEVPKSHTEALQDDADDGELGAGDSGSDGESDEAKEVGPKPYLITIDEGSKEVLSIYRNWEKEDKREPLQARLDWVVEWIFIPFRGAYALGLPHVIGGLSIAATGALRALLDSAHINNMAGLLKLKGAGGTGQNLMIRPTEVTEVEGTGEADDIRKIIMPVPFSPPSSVLMELLGFISQQAEDVIRTTIDESEADGDTPVGTTLARIEQGMIAFSAIHGRLHRSLDRLLKILNRINYTYLEDDDVIRLIGEQIVTRADFETAMDVIPVSDPNVFCEVQRYGQIQTVAQRSLMLKQVGVQVYDDRKVEQLILKQMKLPNDGEDLLLPKPEPQQMNPINENVAVSFGKPIIAFPMQDHDAHIQAHCDFYENPFFQLVCGSDIQALTSLMGNLKQHVVFWYAQNVHRLASDSATQAAKQIDPNSEEIDVGDLPQKSDSDPEVAQKYDKMLVTAAEQVMQKAQQDKSLQRAAKAIQDLQQKIQQIQMQMMGGQQQGEDPQVAMADINRQKQKDQMDYQAKTQATQEKSQSAQAGNATKLQLAQMQSQAENVRAQQQNQTNLQKAHGDNQTALTVEQMKLTGAAVAQQQEHQHSLQEGAIQHGQQMQQAEQQHGHQMQAGAQQQQHERSQAATQQQHEATQAAAQQEAESQQAADNESSNPSTGEATGKDNG